MERRYGGTVVTDGRGDGGLNGKGGAARRKEWHGKERRHDGRPRQRTAEHWAAGKRLWAGREGEARVAAVDHEEVEGRARACERAASERLGGGSEARVVFAWP